VSRESLVFGAVLSYWTNAKNIYPDKIQGNNLTPDSVL